MVSQFHSPNRWSHAFHVCILLLIHGRERDECDATFPCEERLNMRFWPSEVSFAGQSGVGEKEEFHGYGWTSPVMMISNRDGKSFVWNVIVRSRGPTSDLPE